jgi:hypothetical protein
VELLTIASGGFDICGLGADRHAVCWGDGFSDPKLPGAVPPPADVLFDTIQNGDIRAGGVVAGGREIRCWGGYDLDPGPSIDDVMAAHAEPP